MVPKVRTTRRWPMASGNPGAIGVSFDFFLGRKRDAHPSQEVTLIGTGICAFTADRFCLWRTPKHFKKCLGIVASDSWRRGDTVHVLQAVDIWSRILYKQK